MVVQLAIGMAGFVSAFKGAVQAAIILESCFSSNDANRDFLMLRYRMALYRLDQWGSFCGLKSFADIDSSSQISNKPEIVQERIREILDQIENLTKDVPAKLGQQNAEGDTIQTGKESESMQYQHITSSTKLVSKSGHSKSLAVVKSKFAWAIRGKDEFETTVTKLDKLIAFLEQLVPECKLPADALLAPALAMVKDEEQLEALGASGDKINRILTLSARAKSMQSNTTQIGTMTSAVYITSHNLSFLDNSSYCGILHTETAMRSVWVEWKEIHIDSDIRKYIRRIETLACLLARVSEPALCLPPFLGVYEDTLYEMEHGDTKRIGYVFGVPEADTMHGDRSGQEYDDNFRKFQPKTLSQLIRDEREIDAPIPLLGDRFHLALTLAIAFSQFHAAGWLHKGLHSGAVNFLHQSENQTVNIKQPFITGFQFSRPQGEASLLYGPLEDRSLMQYYPPEADKGFTKRLDLYGLGVILCEIGQWRLMGDRFSSSKSKKAAPKDRSAWRKFMIDDVLVDLGWRMGKRYQSAVRILLHGDLPEDGNDELFAQQYLTKVIRPLNSCKA